MELRNDSGEWSWVFSQKQIQVSQRICDCPLKDAVLTELTRHNCFLQGTWKWVQRALMWKPLHAWAIILYSQKVLFTCSAGILLFAVLNMT